MFKNNKHSISIYTNKKIDYPELKLFKQQIDDQVLGPFHQPYTAHKKNVWSYRAIFFALAILHLALGITLYLKTLSWSFTFLFGGVCLAVKPLICSFCGAVTTATLTLGIMMRTEKEAAKTIFQKGKARLKQAYQRKLAQFGLNRFLIFGKEFNKKSAFQHLYHESLEKLHDKCDETIHLLDRISKSPIDREKRERLYNQALLELDERQNYVINSFKSTNFPLRIEQP